MLNRLARAMDILSFVSGIACMLRLAIFFAFFSILDKEDALREQVDINEKLRDAYEKLLQKVNKKKRHVGIGSHDVWHDPQIEKLMGQLNDSEGEIEGLKHELERLKKQRDVNILEMSFQIVFII